MKKVSFLGIMIVFAVLLAACSGGPSSNSTPGANGAGATSGVNTQSSSGTTGTETTSGGTTGTQSSSGVAGTPSAGVTAVQTEYATPLAVPTIVGTSNPGGSSTQSSSGGIPVTGSNPTTNLLRASELLTYTVVDNTGASVGTVQDVVVDLRNASVCNGSASSTSGGASSTQASASPVSATPSMSATGSGGSGSSNVQSSCTPPAGAQQNGLIAYIIVNTMNATGSPSMVGTTTPSVSATGTMSSNSGSTSSSTSGGNLMPVPWSVVSINVGQRQIVVNAAASSLSNAPTFSNSGNWPDITGSDWSSRLNSFWSSMGAGTSGGSSSPSSSTATP